MEPVRKNVVPTKLTQKSFLAKIVNRPKEIFSATNSKMKRTRFHAFPLPAFRGAYNCGGNLKIIRTCPQAGQCAGWCFAQMGTFSFHHTMVAHARNLQWVMDDPDSFEEVAKAEITRRPSIKTVRVHDSGDFFSWDYMMMWFRIMQSDEAKNRGARFYAYTKMVSMVKNAMEQGLVPDNMRFIFSYGGREDHLIDPATDRHSRVFQSQEECEDAGYTYLGDDDSLAAEGEDLRIGLVYHSPCTYKHRRELVA